MNSSSTSTPNNTSSSHETSITKIEGMIYWLSAFGVASLLVVATNLLTIILFAINNNLRKRSFYLMINMAIADLLVGALSCPLYMYSRGEELELWTVSGESHLEIAFRIVDTFVTKASLNSAVSISVERLYATCYPFKHRTLTSRAYFKIIPTIWLLSIFSSGGLLVAAFFASSQMFFYLSASWDFLLVLVICGCYIGVTIKFKRRTISTQQQLRAEQEKRLTNTLILISFVTWLTWLPLLIVAGIPLHIYINPHFLLFADLLNYGNSIINPVLYSLRIPQFRKALRFHSHRRFQISRDVMVNEERKSRSTQMSPNVRDTKL